MSMATYPIYISDETTLKELSRGTMSVVYTSDGVVEWKRNLWSVPTPILNLPGSDPQAVIDSLRPWDTDDFIRISLMTVTLLLLLAAADRAAVLRYLIRSEKKGRMQWRGKCQGVIAQRINLKRKSRVIPEIITNFAITEI